jgi:hypothetical protein
MIVQNEFNEFFQKDKRQPCEVPTAGSGQPPSFLSLLWIKLKVSCWISKAIPASQILELHCLKTSQICPVKCTTDNNRIHVGQRTIWKVAIWKDNGNQDGNNVKNSERVWKERGTPPKLKGMLAHVSNE